MGWNAVIDTIKDIGTMAENFVKILFYIFKMLPKLVSSFEYLTDPLRMLTDFYWGVKKGVEMIFNTLIDMTFGKLSRSINLSALNEHGSDDENIDPNKSEEALCATPNLIELILLILCPPFALFTKLGLKGIIHIIVASILTYFYYFPGLMYTSMYVL